MKTTAAIAATAVLVSIFATSVSLAAVHIQGTFVAQEKPQDSLYLTTEWEKPQDTPVSKVSSIKSHEHFKNEVSL